MPKFVKGGKLYDTDTATQIGTIEELLMGGAKNTLFKTKKGAFFLHVLSRPIMGQVGESVRPMSLEEARTWAEGYLGVEAVCRFFEVEEA